MICDNINFRDIRQEGNGLVEAIQELQEKVEALEVKTKDSGKHFITGPLFNQGNYYYVDHSVVIPSGTTYENYCDGHSWAKAFRTIDEALDDASAKGIHDFRCRIAGEGDNTNYTITNRPISFQVVHMLGYRKTSRVGGGYNYAVHLGRPREGNWCPVRINFDFDNNHGNAPIYAMHCNFRGLSFRCEHMNADESYTYKYLYTDGGLTIFTYCDTTQLSYVQNGGSVYYNNCYIGDTELEGASMICKVIEDANDTDDFKCNAFWVNDAHRRILTRQYIIVGNNSDVHFRDKVQYSLTVKTNTEYEPRVEFTGMGFMNLNCSRICFEDSATDWSGTVTPANLNFYVVWNSSTVEAGSVPDAMRLSRCFVHLSQDIWHETKGAFTTNCKYKYQHQTVLSPNGSGIIFPTDSYVNLNGTAIAEHNAYIPARTQ